MASFEQCVKVSLTKLKAKIELKQQQLDVLRAVFDGKDTIAVLLTGFGKKYTVPDAPIFYGSTWTQISFCNHDRFHKW